MIHSVTINYSDLKDDHLRNEKINSYFVAVSTSQWCYNECGQCNQRWAKKRFLDGPFNSDKRIIGAFGGTPGGLTDIPPNELPELHTKIAEVFTLLGSQREDFKYRIKRVISGKKQIVSGYRYCIEVEVGN